MEAIQKRSIILLTAIVFTLTVATPCFVNGQEMEDMPATSDTRSAKDSKLLSLLDETINNSDANTERIKTLMESLKTTRGDNNVKLAIVMGCVTVCSNCMLAPITLPVTLSAFCYDQFQEKLIQKRFQAYELAKEELAYCDGTKKQESCIKKYVKDLTKFFMLDPATALDIYIRSDREIFLEIAKKDKDAIRLLLDYNKVVSADPKIFSEYALDKIDNNIFLYKSSKEVFRRLAVYVDAKKGVKEAISPSIQKILNKELKYKDSDKVKHLKYQGNI